MKNSCKSVRKKVIAPNIRRFTVINLLRIKFVTQLWISNDFESQCVAKYIFFKCEMSHRCDVKVCDGRRLGWAEGPGPRQTLHTQQHTTYSTHFTH